MARTPSSPALNAAYYYTTAVTFLSFTATTVPQRRLTLSTVLTMASVLSPGVAGSKMVTLRENKRSISASSAVAGRPPVRRRESAALMP